MSGKKLELRSPSGNIGSILSMNPTLTGKQGLKFKSMKHLTRCDSAKTFSAAKVMNSISPNDKKQHTCLLKSGAASKKSKKQSLSPSQIVHIQKKNMERMKSLDKDALQSIKRFMLDQSEAAPMNSTTRTQIHTVA